MLKNTFLFLVSALFFISCKNHHSTQQLTPEELSHQNLEGTWVENYSQWIDSAGIVHKGFTNLGFIYTFKNDSVHAKKIHSAASTMTVDTIVTYALKNGHIIFGTTYKDALKLDITKDSIVFTQVEEQIDQIILKKLPINTKQVHWNPTGKQYYAFSEETQAHLNFVNDSVMYFFDDFSTRLTKKYWKIEKINNHTILVFNRDIDMAVEFVSIDSLVENKVYTTDYNYRKSSPILEEHENKQAKPTSLFGTWKLVSEEKIMIDGKEVRDPIPKLEKVYINIDSIEITHQALFRYTQSWKYYENPKTIVLNSNEMVVKISKMSQDSLVLSMDLFKHGFGEKEFTFIRE